MAKKKTETTSLIDTFTEFKETKNIDRTTMVGVLEESFRNVIAKIFGSDENFDVIVNPDKGDFEIYRNREVVADNDVTDPNKQMPLSAAREIDPDYEVGEEVSETIDFAKFGRRAILTLRQTLASKILELEHDSLYNKYKDRVGEIIAAEVYQTWKNETLLMDDEHNELLLPKSQQIPRDFFHKGDTVRAVIDRVDNTNGNPKIYLSRTSPEFLRRLLEGGVQPPLCLNVNVPVGRPEELRGIRLCRQNRGFWREEFYRHEDPRGREYFWLTGDFVNQEPEAEDTDEWALAHGYVSVVPVQTDLTDYARLRELTSLFG